MSKFLQLQDGKVTSVFFCKQDPEIWPDLLEVDDQDSRYLAFINRSNDAAMNERIWRDQELVRADEELNKVQDADPKANGTVGDWRAYRKALRAYPESGGFPNKELRPLSP